MRPPHWQYTLVGVKVGEVHESTVGLEAIADQSDLSIFLTYRRVLKRL
jgi:hypothetical protein